MASDDNCCKGREAPSWEDRILGSSHNDTYHGPEHRVVDFYAGKLADRAEYGEHRQVDGITRGPWLRPRTTSLPEDHSCSANQEPVYDSADLGGKPEQSRRWIYIAVNGLNSSTLVELANLIP